MADSCKTDLKNDYIINQELTSIAGSVSLRCGRLLAVANTALITTKHIVFKDNDKEEKEPDIVKHEKVNTTREKIKDVHSNGDSKNHPLEEIDGFDELLDE